MPFFFQTDEELGRLKEVAAASQRRMAKFEAECDARFAKLKAEREVLVRRREAEIMKLAERFGTVSVRWGSGFMVCGLWLVVMVWRGVGLMGLGYRVSHVWSLYLCVTVRTRLSCEAGMETAWDEADLLMQH